MSDLPQYVQDHTEAIEELTRVVRYCSSKTLHIAGVLSYTGSNKISQELFEMAEALKKTIDEYRKAEHNQLRGRVNDSMAQLEKTFSAVIGVACSKKK